MTVHCFVAVFHWVCSGSFGCQLLHISNHSAASACVYYPPYIQSVWFSGRSGQVMCLVLLLVVVSACLSVVVFKPDFTFD